MHYLVKYAVNHVARSLIREAYWYVRNDIRKMADKPISVREVSHRDYY